MKTALAIAPAALILLAGCTSTDAGPVPPAASDGGTRALTGDTAAPGPATSSTAPGTVSTPATTSATATTTATAAPVPTSVPTTFADVNKNIDDGDLKESITVKRVARQVPWPDGYKASAQAYELVAVEMTWTPSKSYTIPIRKQDFDISTGSQFPNRPDAVANETLKATGWALLPDQVDSGDPVTGWVVFKVDPRNPPSMVLDYARPAAQVSGGGSSFPAKTFTVPLVG